MKYSKLFLPALLLIAFTFSAAQTVQAQRTKKEVDAAPAVATTKQSAPANDAYAHHEKVYNQGLKYNDLDIATTALYSMIVLRPENALLKDTLALVYFQRGAFEQSLVIASEILQTQPDNFGMLEVAAVCKQTLGFPKEALVDYERLYLKTASIWHLYEIATLQFGLKRYGECEVSIGKIIADPDATESEITLNVSQNQRQKVPIKAAAMNLKGVMYQEMGKKAEALKQFEEAVKIFPDFAIAKGNIEAMKKAETEGK